MPPRRNWEALTGWVHPPATEEVKRFYAAMVKPILEKRAEFNGTPVVTKAARKLLHELVWGVTTLTNTARWDTRYISEGAKTIFEELSVARAQRRLCEVSKEKLKLVNHEHPFDRDGLVGVLLGAGGSPKALDNAFGCIVTRKEHRLLRNANGVGWDRYRDKKIRVWDRSGSGRWLDW